MSQGFDGGAQLQRAAELRDAPFSKQRAPRRGRRGGTAAAIVNPNGIAGTAIFDGDEASCSFKGHTTTTLGVGWLEP
jgi:hypothetical protein